MELLEQMAEAALHRDSLLLRSLVQDWTRQGSSVSQLTRPITADTKLLIIAAHILHGLSETPRIPFRGNSL